MVLADWIAIGIFLVTIILGSIIGFGKGLKFFSGGIVGFLISIVVCYCFGGLILSIPAVQTLLTKMASAWTQSENGFAKFLTTIHFDIIVYYVILFIVIQILRIVVVRLIKLILEIKLLFFKIVNKFLGVVLFFAVALLLALIVFQIIYLIGGETAENFAAKLHGSLFGLDKLFASNPLAKMIVYIKGSGGSEENAVLSLIF